MEITGESRSRGTNVRGLVEDTPRMELTPLPHEPHAYPPRRKTKTLHLNETGSSAEEKPGFKHLLSTYSVSTAYQAPADRRRWFFPGLPAEQVGQI